MTDVGIGTVVVEETVAGASPAPAVAWSAIIAGAVAAAAVSLILIMLGWAIGLGSVSPWPGSGASLTSFGVGAAIWLIVVQWIAALFGGYLTGRLRTRWTDVPHDEVFFRDTAHGFLAWAVATVFVFGLVGAIASGAAATATISASNVAAGAAAGAGQGVAAAADDTDTGYLVDSLFRTTTPAAAPDSGRDIRAETTRILTRGVAAGEIPDADRSYLAQLVASQTGIAPADAEARVNDVITQAQDLEAKARAAADDARKAALSFSLFLFFSLLIGAFIACVAAPYGGHRRDEP